MSSCDESNKGNKEKSPRIKNKSKLALPKNGSSITIGTNITFKIETEIQVDSIILFKTNAEITSSVGQDSLVWNSISEVTGLKQLSISVYMKGGIVEHKRVNITLLSDIKPEKYTYRVINTFEHDPEAYTQGLFVHEGVFYESTGQRGASTLREVDIQSGKIKRSIDLEPEFFGEGIAVVNNKIFMLTYTSNEGRVYDLNTFKEERRFNYDREGWGLASKGDTLIKSEGTNRLQFMEPENFTPVKTLHVFDQTSPINDLNELEVINGDIFANRYHTNQIYIIDSSTGKVKGIIDLSGIFNQSDYNRRIDVLNGIAFNEDSQTYYVTGKYWPKLFEISIVSINNI